MKRGETSSNQKNKTVRFSALVASAGKPEIYLPLFDPKQDKKFMSAVKEDRVLSIRQDPTSERTDFGTVGFDEKKFTTLLIFPKPLTAFADARVVGIKYDLVAESSIVASAGPRGPKLPKPKKAKQPQSVSPFPSAEEPRRAEPEPEPKPLPPPEPPKRVEPEPITFRVRLRIMTVTEKDVEVQAMTKAEAKQKAQARVESEDKVQVVSVTES